LPTLSPQAHKAKLQEIWVEQLVGLAAQRPVLMLLEDAHWIDPSSLEQFDLIIDRIQSLPVLLVVTFRPEFQQPWGRFPHVTALSLNRLSPRQSAAMVQRIAGSKALPAEVLEQVVGKADGVPLFVEELTKAVLESDLLKDADDHWQLAGPLPPLAIPATLHDSLMARLDRLAPVKEVAQVASVIGREFPYDLLAAAVDLDGGKLNQALGHLAAAELVFRRSMPPNEVYAFKHVLVQEVAYASLLRSKRQQFHARLALILQERFPDIGKSQPEILAHHFTEAGLADEAIGYWLQAGQRAAERSAGPEAVAHLNKALELTRKLPDPRRRSERELTLQIALAPVLMMTEGFGSAHVRQAYLRARELCHEVGDADQLFKATFGLWHVTLNRGDLRAGQLLADEALTLAQQQGSPAYLLQAHHAAWTTLFNLGALVACRDHAERGRSLYDVDEHQSHKFIFGGHDPGVCARNHGALASWLLGHPDQALELSRESIGLAQNLGHPMTLMMAHCFASFLHQFRGEPQAARARAEATLVICTEQGIAPPIHCAARIIRGWARAALGEPESGVEEVREALAALLATEMHARRPHYLTLLAEAEALAGHPDRALAALEQA
jgi:predicted ATPase